MVDKDRQASVGNVDISDLVNQVAASNLDAVGMYHMTNQIESNVPSSD